MSSLFTTVVLTIITLFLLGYIARMRSMCPPAVFNRREKFISIFLVVVPIVLIIIVILLILIRVFLLP